MSDTDSETEALAVVVHAGAGWQYQDDKVLRTRVRKLLRRVVKKAQIAIDQQCEWGHPLERSFLEAASVVEKDELTNTACGSFPRNDGSVRCDSCMYVVNTDSKVVECGAVVCNSSGRPIEDAWEVVVDQRHKNRQGNGVVSPIVTVGRPWDDDTRWLLTKRMEKTYKEVKEYGSVDSVGPTDTVGVIVADPVTGRMYVGSSSGGGLMCSPRRVGCAGVLGAACWAGLDGSASVGVTASGQGEAIIKAGLARRVGEAVLGLYEEEEPVIIAKNVLALLAFEHSIHEQDVVMAVMGVIVRDGYATQFYAATGPGAFPVASSLSRVSGVVSGGAANSAGIRCGQWEL